MSNISVFLQQATVYIDRHPFKKVEYIYVCMYPSYIVQRYKCNKIAQSVTGK